MLQLSKYPYLCVNKRAMKHFLKLRTMTLTAQQIKIAKNLCKSNGLDVKLVNKNLGNGFWEDNCGGTFEGYLAYLLRDASKRDGSILQAGLDQSTRNYRAGRSGATSLTK